MVEFGRWEDRDFGQPKVWREVGGVRFVDEVRMSHGILAVLVDPRVETGVVVLPNFF